MSNNVRDLGNDAVDWRLGRDCITELGIGVTSEETTVSDVFAASWVVGALAGSSSSDLTVIPIYKHINNHIQYQRVIIQEFCGMEQVRLVEMVLHQHYHLRMLSPQHHGSLSQTEAIKIIIL